jgi:hypothetical protein
VLEEGEKVVDTVSMWFAGTIVLLLVMGELTEYMAKRLRGNHDPKNE